MTTKLFYLHNTIGLPLEISCIHLRNKGIPIDFTHFCKDAAIAGWKGKQIYSTIKEVATEKELHDTVLQLIKDECCGT